jgi:hypothetical protein
VEVISNVNAPRSAVRSIAWLGFLVLNLRMSISDNHKRNVWDKVKHKHNDFEKAQENVDRKMEGIFRNWNPFVVYFKKPITGKPYQERRQNQQPSIDNGAPLKECSNYVVIHNYYSFCFLRLTSTRSATADESARRSELKGGSHFKSGVHDGPTFAPSSG